MRNHLHEATGAGLSQLQVSFTLKRKNKRGSCSTQRQEAHSAEPGNVPRISKLMALANRFDGLIRRGEVQDYADLARLGQVTRARITQIMGLLNLAPDIQEAILFLPRTVRGRDPIRERDVRPIASVPHWSRQRKMWVQLTADQFQ
ncbi:MAG: hypothetical protein KKH67_11540 [candidate division Zixibacteria bacterium]|nr:hypothetical protein [candidate division Zixibacteria bacterium]